MAPPNTNPSHSTTALLLLLVTLPVTLLHTPTTALPPPRITGFNLVRRDTGTFVKKLTHKATIIRHPALYTVRPRTTGAPDNVTFVSPQRYVAPDAPFTLLTLPPFPYGTLSLIAYASRGSLSSPFFYLTVYVRPPHFAVRGPSSLSAFPVSYEDDALRKVGVPLASRCTRALPPKIIDFSVSPFATSFRLRSCRAGASVRIRRMSLSVQRTPATVTKTLTVHSAAVVKTPFQPFFFGESPRNLPANQLIYYEVCEKRRAETTAISCVTSPFELPPRQPLVPPVLAFRPPVALPLRAGDGAVVRVAVRAVERGDVSYVVPFVSGEHFGGNLRKYWLRLLVLSRTGRVLQWGAGGIGDSASIRLGVGKFAADGGGVSGAYDGARVVVQYAYADDVGNRDDFGATVYATLLSVKEKNASLKRQDSKLPSFATPTLKGAGVGKPVTITVRARNGGGGLLGGKKTGLTYQWHRLSFWGWGERSVMERLKGETGSVLRIEKLEEFSYDAGTSAELYTYFVDVCNTFGCRRSEGVDIGTLLDSYNPIFEP